MIVLEPFTETDFDRLISWIPSAEFLVQWTGPIFTFPLDRAQLQEHIAQASGSSPRAFIFKALSEEDAEVVGHGELAAINRGQAFASISRILVGPPEMRGRGIGEAIVRKLLTIGFEDLSLERIALHVFDFNAPAIRCYERVGFKRESILHNARQFGQKSLNLLVMSISAQDYRSGLARQPKAWTRMP